MSKKNKKLYSHKTDGGAVYLTDTFIAWRHNGKQGREGTVTLDTKICIRVDGQPEILAGFQVNAELLDALIGLLKVCQCTNGCDPSDMTCASNVARKAILHSTEK